jgi:hypothetical protein
MKLTIPGQQEFIRTNEDFTQVDNRPIDSRHRVTLSDHVFKALPKKFDSVSVLIGTQGSILLVPRISIPANEAWLHENPKINNNLRKAMQQVKEGKVTRVKNQQKFFDSL